MRSGSYDNFFPSASAKYSITPNLSFQTAYSHTISRPNLTYISGLLAIDETNQIVRLPNPSLKPEISDNLSARLAYYFEPVGSLAIGVFQNSIKNLRVEKT